MLIHIEVAYAGLQGSAWVKELRVKQGTTVQEAIGLSRILALNPCDSAEKVGLTAKEKKTLHDRVGIFGQRVELSTTLKAGDRVEIYRDLIHDPKDARRARALIAKKDADRQRASSKKR